MGLNWAEHSEEIAAPIETCFGAIVDYESFSSWQDAVDSTEVLDRTEDGLGHKVKLFVDAKVRKIDYVLAYRYERPTKIEWDFVEGNGMNGMDGAYTFEELTPERTRATYNLGADPAIPVPGMVARRVHKQLVKNTVEDLKREAERRHEAGESVEEAPERRFGRSRSAEDDEAAASEAAEAGAERAEEWVPKAEREAASRPDPEPAARSGSSGSPGIDSLTDLPTAVVGKAVSTGRDVAEGAMRAGMGAVKSAIGIGREVADGLIRRVNRKLGADRGRDES